MVVLRNDGEIGLKKDVRQLGGIKGDDVRRFLDERSEGDDVG